MKIAIDIRSTLGRKAGKGWYTFHLLNALLEADSKNQYILYTSEKQENFLKYKNVEERIIKNKGIIWHFAVLRDLARQKVDLFIAPTSYIIPAFAPKSLKTILPVHDLVAFLFPKNHNKKATLIEKSTLKRATKKAYKIITVSKNTQQDLEKQFSKQIENIHQKTHTIYPAVSANFRPINKNLKKFKEEKNLTKDFFLVVGTIEPRKNIETILKAHKKLIDPNKKPKDQPHLILIGARGWKFSKVFTLLNELGTAEYVTFKGYTKEEDLIKYYNTALALVFPSLYEGFGLPALEAMQAGCPVITSNKGSLPELAKDAALSIDPKNTEELAKSMKKIYDDPALRLELSTKGLKRAEEFSWQKAAKEFLKVINSSK